MVPEKPIHKTNSNINRICSLTKRKKIYKLSHHPLLQYIRHLKLREDKQNYKDNEIM